MLQKTLNLKRNKPSSQTDLMRRKVHRIHFIGIGGIGMSGIAEVLLNLGYVVSGSDLSSTDITQRLASLGADISLGHSASNVGPADVVVTSTAVKGDNPEVLEARHRNIPVIPRAEMLAELLKMKFSIAVSGSHGKTTTTSMISTILAHGKLDPTMVIGGKLASIGSSARMGNGEVIVAEADESDKSFLKLNPCLAVITNIDLEHLEHYHDLTEIKEAFLRFSNQVPFYGATIVCLDDPHVREILPRVQRRTITYGLSAPADYRAGRIMFRGKTSTFTLYHKDRVLGRMTLNAPGLFNVSNALAAITIARELDLPIPVIREGLKSFQGVHRRLEVRGKVHGITIVDDYGHHPTEIRETLKAAKQVWPGRLHVVFQPHRYTRTRALFKEFLTAFVSADRLILTDIYPASEAPIRGVHSRRLCEGILEAGQEDAVYLSDFGKIVDHLSETVRSGDVVLTLGAGTVWKVGESFLAAEVRKKQKGKSAVPAEKKIG
jgi:UDP-N-acetylmuramate--alanine ligase